MGGSPDPQPRETTTTTTSEPPAFVRPFITGQGLSGALQGADPNALLPRAFQLSQEGLQPTLIPGEERVAPFTPSQQLSLAGLETLGLSGTPETQAAGQQVVSTLNRDPTQNPLVDSLVATSQGDIVDQFNTEVAPQIASASRRSGSFGNTGIGATDAQARFSLARALGDVESQIRLPAFESERGRQIQAAQLAPSIAGQRFGELQSAFGAGQTRQAQEQSIRDIDAQNLQEQRLEPLRTLDVLGSAINTGSGGFGTQTTTGQRFMPPSPNPFLTGLGAGGSFLGGAGQLASAFK